MNSTSASQSSAPGRAMQHRAATSSRGGDGGGSSERSGRRGSGLTSEVRSIMDNVVTPSSVKTYTNGIVNFFIWVFDDDSINNLLFKDWFLQDITDGNAKDLALTPKKRKGRKHLRSAIKDALLSIIRDDKDTHPFLFDSFTFQIFSCYLTSRMKTITVKKNGDGEIDDLNGEEETMQVYFGKATYDGIRSSIMHLYRVCDTEMNEAFTKCVTQYIAGMKRSVAKQKKETGQKLTEGKRDMPLNVYAKLCEILLRGDSDEYTFAHAFLTIEWNLMARSDNVVHLSVEHIEWCGDCLVFYFATTKTDQNGEKQRLPWHVYSNPAAPHICPVLAFSKYVLSHPGVLQNDARNKLFPGDNQYNRFLKIFHQVVEKHSSEILALGVDPNDLGSHSTRKGSATLVSSGCVVSPPHSSLCLRAGWSMGGVKDRYIHHESAGDQFVGRTVTGLSCLSTDFACSPCYFVFTETEDKEGMRQQLDDFI